MRRQNEYHSHLFVAVLAAIFALFVLFHVARSNAATPAETGPAPAGTNGLNDARDQGAYSTKGIARTEEVGVAKPVDIVPPYHQVFVLCVGINDNPAYPQLRYAVNDASQVAATFRNTYGFTNVTLLTNSHATRASVLAALEDIRSRVTANDDFIFYFSGHGDTWREGLVQNGHTNIVSHGFLVTYDAATNFPESLAELQKRNLELTSLAGRIVDLPARHRLIFLDSCFSGLAYINQDVVEKQPDDFNQEVIKHSTVTIMTAGLDSQQALEDSHEGHGLFTAALLKQLNSDNILTMEELYFPLRTEVRKSMEQLGAGQTMDPQLRYLVATNGSFIFVPLDELPVWANAKSDNSSVTNEEAKGYLRPVTIEEVTNVSTMASAPPEQRQELVDRYQARAAMGDPLATIALAQIYKGGLGVPPDPAQAKIYTSESSDLYIAGSSYNIAALAGITNQAVQALVGNLMKGYSLNDLFGARGAGLGNNQNTIAMAATGFKYAAPVIGAVGNWTVGLFGKSPIKRLIGSQKKIKSLLANPTPQNITNAKKELLTCEDALAKMGSLWPADGQPAEFGQLNKLVHAMETNLDQNQVDQAVTGNNDAEAVIDSLQTLLKAQAAAKKS